MKKLYRGVCFVALVALASTACAGFARAQQQPATTTSTFKAKAVIGFNDVKKNKKGQVALSGSTLEFTSGTIKSDLPVASIQDVLTGADSQRAIGGTVGTISMFGPYGSGRFLSLFRTKIDALTIEYRDADGGLHGAILTVPQGQAAALKTQLVAAGAKASISVEDEEKAAAAEKQKGKKQ